ncbi:MAG: TIGR02171 family protein [Fibrobacter sp.]|nr:TIGR02171 family protein [Fibrobacter sp.]
MKLWASVLSCLFLLAACDDHSSSSEELPPEEDLSSSVPESSGSINSSAQFAYPSEALIGMNLIDDASKVAELENKMKVSIDYDYYIGTREVTCGEFFAFIPYPPIKTAVCADDSLPVANVSFFDAVLFLNAKSKAHHLDTAYSYTNILYDTEGHVLNLESFAFHNDANGFRLPTESEWTYVASKGWKPQKSWNASNSNFTSHKVCSIGNDSQGYCDFAGNVMEWANDWYSPLFDTTVVNYTGAPDGGIIGKRVVKGGCYANSEASITLFSRNDIYTITSATRSAYIGFRLALGAIPNPTWMDGSKNTVISRTIPLASASIIKNIYKTYNAKLVFRNDVSQKLNLIKYNEDIPAVIEINDTLNAYHPDISPDGKYVAFCTNLEGVTGKSKLYVRDLNETGIKHVELDVESAAIPRWRVLENGDTVITYVTDAGNNKDNATFAATSTWQVKFENGKFGTPEKLFDGAYHGGISSDGKLAVTGARLLRARVNGVDTIWYNGNQACNASLAMDGTKRTVFLDFGGETGSGYVGSSYTAHEYAFIADSTGKLLQAIKAKSGYTYDHVEWASDGIHSNIVATLADNNGLHGKIVLIDPNLGTVTDLAESDDLWHPCLWVKRTAPANSSTHLNPDSAGIYFIPGYPENVIQWRYKMESFWQFKDSATTVFLGSSRSHYGLVPENITSPDLAINMAVPFNVNHGVYFLAKNYVLNLMPKLKYIVIGLDMDRFVVPSSSSFFLTLYKNLPGYTYDENHKFWAGEDVSEMYEMTHGALGRESYAIHLLPPRGYDDGPGHPWPAVPEIVRDTIWSAVDSASYRENFNYIEETLKLAKAKNIRVVGVELPSNPNYRNTGAYGKEGIQRSKAPALLQEIADLSKTYPNFTFFDANQMGNHDFYGDVARDSDHLGHDGAHRITTKIDSLLKTLP